MEDGQIYTLQQLTDTLCSRKSDTNFVAIIKPDQSCPYKVTVDLLNAMTLAHVSKYAMVSIRPDEEDFCSHLNK
jgi:hypothetical protein